MGEIVSALKKAMPESMKAGLRSMLYQVKTKNFKPYIKKKNMEGVSFDFWIGDADGRDWYDVNCTDPVCMEMRFMREQMVTPGDVILEAGAHHGCMSILLSRWVGSTGRIVAFEALPANCDIIRKNLALNGLSNVTLEPRAVGAEKGKISFNLVSNASVSTDGRGVEVDVTRLDDYEALNPTLLKIDVEGFELQVLRGARKILAKRPKLAIEIHTEELGKYGASVEEIFRIIGAENYRLWVQWNDTALPEPYDGTRPITSRVHLFALPRKG